MYRLNLTPALLFAAGLSILAAPAGAQQQTAPSVPTPQPAAQTPPPTPPVVETPDMPGAVWAPASPKNFQPVDPAAPPRAVEYVVIHDIEGTAAACVSWFQNPQAQASSHYVVDGETGRIYQMVKERDVAWHAGNRDINTRSVGIEHHGYAYRPGFYDLTLYEASARLVREITNRYKIPRDRTHIIAHGEVPDPANPGQFGGRSHHTDPGPYWDWDAFMSLVRSDARVDGTIVTPILHPGEKKTAVITVINQGDDPWPLPGGDGAKDSAVDSGRVAFAKREPVYLGVWPAPGGLARPVLQTLYDPRGWASPRLVVLPQGGSDIAPGATATFAFSVQAPPVVVTGPVTEQFRLFRVPVAPRLPLGFGPVVPVSVRVEPWDLQVKAVGSPAASSTPAAPVAAGAAAPPPQGTFTPAAGWQQDGDVFLRSFSKQESKAPSVEAPAAQWGMTLPAGGVWEVYVRWPAGGKGRTRKATYEIAETSKGAPQSVTVDQRKAPAGKDAAAGWQPLGRFRLGNVGARNIAATIRLRAEEAGVVAADAVRFVGPFPEESTPPQK